MGWGLGNLGNTVDSIPNNISTVRDGDTTTMTLTYNDGRTSELVIKYENGEPVKITVDGKEITLGWSTILYILYLYNNGDMCEDITGGWDAKAYAKGSVTQKKTPTLNTSGKAIGISLTTKQNSAQGSVITVNKIDITNYTKLCFNVTSLSSNGKITFGITSAPGSSYKMELPLVAVKGLNEIDISDVSGEYTIAIAVTAYANETTTAKIDSIYLE